MSEPETEGARETAQSQRAANETQRSLAGSRAADWGLAERNSGQFRIDSRFGAIISGKGRRREAIAAALRAELEPNGGLALLSVTSSEEATALAANLAGRVEYLVAVGGDGTVADVATGIFGSTTSLGIIPAGSTNIIARSLGIPADPFRAVKVLAAEFGLRRIDVGRCHDRCFLHMAGVGFDAALFASTDPKLKRALGWIAYLPAAATAARIPPSWIEVQVDGERIETMSPLVLVSNGSALITPGLEVYPDIQIDDGRLDILVFETVTPAQAVAAFGLTGLRLLHTSRLVTRLRGSSVSIAAEPALLLQLDGDVRGQTPVELSIVHHGMNVAVPA